MDDQVVLVTGASSGLGAEMARQFAALGYDLALCARRIERLKALADEIVEETGRRVEIAALDVTDEESVPRVFAHFEEAFGRIDRVVVNAGLGKGSPLGTGRAYANRQTAMTNFVGALAQIDAALEVFRRQERGHLVLISSVMALRGMRKSMTTYAATKAAIASVAEGLRSERVKGLDVSLIYPGYIKSEMNEHVRQKTRFIVDTEPGTRAIVRAVEKRRKKAYVPAWPWVPIAFALKVLPLAVVRRFV